MADAQKQHSKARSKRRAAPRRRYRPRAADAVDASLVTALGKLPESRADMLTRARRLARDPNYPSDLTLRLISEILAAHLQFDGFSF